MTNNDSLFALDVHLEDIDHSQRDPNYRDRFAIVEARRHSLPVPSPHIQRVGRLANQAAFISPIDFNALAGLALAGGNKRPLTSIFEIPFTINRSRKAARYIIPAALKQFSEAIAKIAQHEHGLYPFARYYGALNATRLTVDQTPVQPGGSQRGSCNSKFLGHYIRMAHRDGDPKQIWEHGYVVKSNQSPDYFALDPVPDELAHSEAYRDSAEIPITPELDAAHEGVEPFEIAFSSNSTYHASPILIAGGRPTFLRLAYRHAVTPVDAAYDASVHDQTLDHCLL